VLLETHQHEVQPGDLYLMCSDGLSDMLDDASIAQVLQAHDVAGIAAVQALIDAANDAGGKDNISVVWCAPPAARAPARSWWPWWPFRR
jgi:serine/threonine protein phosphatase PrpC